MLAQIIFWPQQASNAARQVDTLLFVLLGITGAMVALVAGLLVGFAVRYRRRPGQPLPPYIKNYVPLELFWTLTPLAIFMVLFVWGATVYYGAYRPPDNATVIYGVGKQWMWKFQHPEGQREINQLHVAVDEPFQVVLVSEDVIHSFFVPDFRVHMDVLPNRYTSVWFQPTRTGVYQLECSQFCGTGHADMVGTVIVMGRTEYDNWLHLQAEGSMALQGRKLFLKYRCISCHSPGPTQHAPLLEDLYGHAVTLTNGQTALVDDEYIRRHILQPGEQVVEGWRNIMPSFEGQVNEEEIMQIIAFVKSLHHGETPPRVDEYPPPIKKTPAIQPEKEKKP